MPKKKIFSTYESNRKAMKAKPRSTVFFLASKGFHTPRGIEQTKETLISTELRVWRKLALVAGTDKTVTFKPLDLAVIQTNLDKNLVNCNSRKKLL